MPVVLLVSLGDVVILPLVARDPGTELLELEARFGGLEVLIPLAVLDGTTETENHGDEGIAADVGEGLDGGDSGPGGDRPDGDGEAGDHGSDAGAQDARIQAGVRGREARG